MTVAKEIISTLNYNGDPVALRCKDINNYLVDLDLDKVSGVSMHTIWFNEKEDLIEHGDVLATAKEIKTGRFASDGSNDSEFVESVIRLLKFEERELNSHGTKKESCFYVTGQVRLPSGLHQFEGYVLAVNRVVASKSAQAYYGITKNVNHLVDVRVDYAKRHKLVDGFTPTMHYVEKSLKPF